MKRFLALLALWPLGAGAATPSDTPTLTATSTATSTPTPGEGSYVIAPDELTNGSTGNSLEMTFTAGPSGWSASGGLLTVFFPLGLSNPGAGNFYPIPADAPKVLSRRYFGNLAQFHVANVSAGSTLTFRYGYDPSGFAVATSSTSLALEVYSNIASAADIGAAGGRLEVQPTLEIQSPSTTPTHTPTLTATPTGTISPTHSITETHSVSPTRTISATLTTTLTHTPIGEIKAGELYTYPNPFDLAKFSKVTLRFPADPAAKVTIFNLVGEPVAELLPGDINGAAGWAIWRGKDEYNRFVPGGAYYARVKGASTFVKRFTVLN